MEQRLIEANIAAQNAKDKGDAILATAVTSGDGRDNQAQHIKELVEENARAAATFNEIIESTKHICDQQLTQQAEKMSQQEILFNDQIKSLHDQARVNEERHINEVKQLSNALLQARTEFTQFRLKTQEDFQTYQDRMNRENAELLQSESDT